MTTSVDTNAMEVHQLEGLSVALELLDLFKGNLQEVSMLAGGGCGGSPEDALAALAHCGGREVVVTCGAGGAHFSSSATGKTGRVPACEVRVQDSTGAGDACCAGLLAAWVLGASLQEAVGVGCATGAVNCLAVGGSAVPVSLAVVREALQAKGQAAAVEHACPAVARQGGGRDDALDQLIMMCSSSFEEHNNDKG